MSDWTDILAAADRFIEAERRTRRRLSVAHIEAQGARDIGVVFKRQKQALLRRLAHISHQFGAGHVTWEPAWAETRLETRRKLETVTRDLHTVAMEAGARTVVDTTGTSWRGREARSVHPKLAATTVTFDPASDRAARFLQTRGGRLITGIDDTTRDEVGRVIAGGVEEGASYRTIAGRLTGLFDGFAGSRAQTIAVTETAYAYSYAQTEVSRELVDNGIPMVKTWITADDDRVDEDCQSNADDGTIAFDDTFSTGDDSPPAHPDCRCDLAVEPDTSALGVDVSAA